MKHEFVKSTLGHGETMCTRCRGTNRELAVLGLSDCPVIGFVAANAKGDQFRSWEASGPCWVLTKKEAVVFVRRADAEKVFAEDEDAWHILPVEEGNLV